ncbi:MAG: RsmB/NOP family class I SAM-dependent RNA methyltransferase [Candidatus Jordarchaeales archaeon]
MAYERALGYVYVQEGGSMIPPLFLELRPEDYVLDLCAAPGSKTTQMAQLMRNEGVIIANDVSLKRISSLGFNIQLCGVLNTAITMSDGRKLPLVFKEEFDKVLVDAPCSSTGHLLSKRPPSFTKGKIKALHFLQRELLIAGFKMLKPGGILVYSTCSIHPLENEAVVNYLLSREEKARVEYFDVKGLKFHTGLTEFEGKTFHPNVENCARIYPHDNHTDAFFIARIKKER